MADYIEVFYNRKRLHSSLDYRTPAESPARPLHRRSSLTSRNHGDCPRSLTQPRSTVVHADHGTQFTPWSFGENLRRWNLVESFGTVGECFDNAVMESFWGRMQTELLDTRKWLTMLELTTAMADYIDTFSNVERRHSSLGNVSPAAYETLWHDVQPHPSTLMKPDHSRGPHHLDHPHGVRS